MSYVNELKSKHGGLTAHIVKTEKFKTVSLIFKMLAPLTKDQVTKRALLPHVLLRGTKSHPKTAELRSYLDELYGTSVSADLTKKGERHVITFRLEIPNEKYLKDQTPLLEKGLPASRRTRLFTCFGGRRFSVTICGSRKTDA